MPAGARGSRPGLGSGVGMMPGGAAAPAQSIVRVFRLKNANAADVAPILERVFAARPLQIATDERTNSLILSGTAEQLRESEPLIQVLVVEKGGREPDPATGAGVGLPTEGQPAKKAILEVVRLEKAETTEMARILEQILAAKPWTTALRVVPDQRTNSLLLQGDAEQLEEARKLILQLEELEGRDARKPANEGAPKASTETGEVPADGAADAPAGPAAGAGEAAATPDLNRFYRAAQVAC